MLPMLLSRFTRLKLGVSLITPPGSIGDNPTNYHRFHKWLTTRRFFLCHLPSVRRFRHVLLILMRRAPYAYSTERMEFEMALEKTQAAVVALNDAANRLIAKANADDAALQQHVASAEEVAAADQAVAASIQTVTDTINQAVPPA